MSLPRDQLLNGASHPERMAELLDQAEETLRTWQPSWSPFSADQSWRKRSAWRTSANCDWCGTEVVLTRNAAVCN